MMIGRTATHIRVVRRMTNAEKSRCAVDGVDDGFEETAALEFVRRDLAVMCVESMRKKVYYYKK